MVASNLHIEIVRSSKTWLSSLSQESAEAIAAVLFGRFRRVGIRNVDNIEDLESLALSKPDLVFLGVKFVPADSSAESDYSERVWVSDFLDSHDIVYTGSSQIAHLLELDKSLAKQAVLNADLKTSPFIVIGRDEVVAEEASGLNFPLFVKPLNRGGGLGIDKYSLVNNVKELNFKATVIGSNLLSDSLVEEYLPGREFSVAILRTAGTSDYSLMSLELIAPSINGTRVLSGNVKSSNSEQALPVVDEELKNKVEELAMNVFLTLGARDYGRIDIRLDQLGEPHFLEANLLPSLISGYGSFPKACLLSSQMTHQSMIINIVELALERLPGEPAIAEPVPYLKVALDAI